MRSVLGRVGALLVAMCFAFLSGSFEPAYGAPISGQGTWETTLKPRDINHDGVVDAYFDTVQNITWLADWGAMFPGRYVAEPWVANLNVYGVTGWRFPSALNSDGSGPCAGNNCADSEMGHLWYVTLGNIAYDFDYPDGTGLTNTGPFLNMRTDYPIYWNLEGDRDYVAWAFIIDLGRQLFLLHQQNGSVVPVKDGDIPEPRSLALFLLGVAWLVATRRQRFLRMGKGTQSHHFVAIALATTVFPASAAIINGSFESGNFAGWTRVQAGHDGYAAVVDSQAGGPMISGTYSALLVALNGQAAIPCPQDPWHAICPNYPPIPFPDTPAFGPTLANPFPNALELADANIVWLRFAAQIGQDIFGQAGDHITLDWRWLSNDVPFPATATDGVVFLITNGTSVIGVNSKELGGPECGGSESITGFRHSAAGCPFDVELPSTGIWTLYAAVGHGAEDVFGSSGVLLDNVSIQRVPEPSTATLLVALVIALPALCRRDRSLKARAGAVRG